MQLLGPDASHLAKRHAVPTIAAEVCFDNTIVKVPPLYKLYTTLSHCTGLYAIMMYICTYQLAQHSGGSTYHLSLCKVCGHLKCAGHCAACAARPPGMYQTAQPYRALLVLGSAVFA